MYDRTVAPAWLYNTNYRKANATGDCVGLEIHGVPMTTAETAPENSDLEAVLKGYISVGKVRSIMR